MINDGNYYLLAIDDKSGQMRNYRVDRMKNVSLTKERREGDEEFRKIDIRTYAQRTFSMFEGKQEHVTMQFIMPLLDTVIDRFGTGREIQYFAKGEKYFTVTADVKITDQFFGWILGFGRKAAILSPRSVVDEFTAYLDKVRSMYEEHADD
jgi:predicted DNA-binding transcriptional regulator YafY